MKSQRTAIVMLAAAILFALSPVAGQQTKTSDDAQPQNQSDMGGMNMGDMQHDTAKNPDAARSAMDAMSGEMDMNPHMFMTALRPENSADDERAAEIVETLRKSIDRYKDYRVALADGYKIFLPNVPQKQYHFTNYRNAIKAMFRFDPAQPTSLLYKKVNGGYELEGAMFTDRRRATEAELNKRVPLSVARWHKHVNLCLPPRREQDVNWKEFGPAGSIATKDACEAANGRWIPQIFGWMVHVYPYRTDPSQVWAH